MLEYRMRVVRTSLRDARPPAWPVGYAFLALAYTILVRGDPPDTPKLESHDVVR
jgi:hypothetical protein